MTRLDLSNTQSYSYLYLLWSMLFWFQFFEIFCADVLRTSFARSSVLIDHLIRRCDTCVRGCWRFLKLIWFSLLGNFKTNTGKGLWRPQTTSVRTSDCICARNPERHRAWFSYLLHFIWRVARFLRVFEIIWNNFKQKGRVTINCCVLPLFSVTLRTYT